MPDRQCRVHRRWKYIGLIALFIVYASLLAYLSNLIEVMLPLSMGVLIILRRVFEVPEENPYKPLNWKELLPWIVMIVGTYTAPTILLALGGPVLFMDVMMWVLPIITFMSLCAGVYAIWEKYHKKPQ